MATKQTIFASLASILLLASCSQEEIINNEPNVGRKAIGYHVTADRATRAKDIYHSTNVPGRFVLGAWHHTGNTTSGKVYIDADLISKDGSSGTYANSRSGQRYWPTEASDKLNFFAYAGDEAASFSLVDGSDSFSPRLTSVEVDADAANHNDLVYACAYDKDQTNTTNGAVELTFKHAMSQVAVAAKNENPCVHVEVSEVALGGMVSAGTFLFPATSTETASWTGTSGSDEITTTITAASLSSTATLLTADNSQVFMMIPQTYTAATHDGTGFSGAYFRINCKIYNIAKPDTNAADNGYMAGSDVLIHDGDIFIPVAFNWSMGSKYTYTINFGTGTAGLDEDGKPTLVALNVATPTVEDWGTPEEKNVNAD